MIYTDRRAGDLSTNIVNINIDKRADDISISIYRGTESNK